MPLPKVSNLFGSKKNKLTRSRPPSVSLFGNNKALETSASQEEKKLLEAQQQIRKIILAYEYNPNEEKKWQNQLNNIQKRLNELRQGYAYKQPGGRRTRKQRRRRMTRRRR